MIQNAAKNKYISEGKYLVNFKFSDSPNFEFHSYLPMLCML